MSRSKAKAPVPVPMPIASFLMLIAIVVGVAVYLLTRFVLFGPILQGAYDAGLFPDAGEPRWPATAGFAASFAVFGLLVVLAAIVRRRTRSFGSAVFIAITLILAFSVAGLAPPIGRNTGGSGVLERLISDESLPGWPEILTPAGAVGAGTILALCVVAALHGFGSAVERPNAFQRLQASGIAASLLALLVFAGGLWLAVTVSGGTAAFPG